MKHDSEPSEVQTGQVWKENDSEALVTVISVIKTGSALGHIGRVQVLTVSGKMVEYSYEGFQSGFKLRVCP